MYTLILFAVFVGGAQAAVNVGFNAPESCAIGARLVAEKLQADNPGAKITWACVKQ